MCWISEEQQNEIRRDQVIIDLEKAKKSKDFYLKHHPPIIFNERTYYDSPRIFELNTIITDLIFELEELNRELS